MTDLNFISQMVVPDTQFIFNKILTTDSKDSQYLKRVIIFAKKEILLTYIIMFDVDPTLTIK